MCRGLVLYAETLANLNWTAVVGHLPVIRSVRSQGSLAKLVAIGQWVYAPAINVWRKTG
jgi:hypothetical protein